MTGGAARVRDDKGGERMVRNSIMRWLAPAMLLTLALPSQSRAQSAADSAAIRATALDYIEGWYEGNAARMERAVHPDLAKRIVNTNPNGRSVLGHQSAMTLVLSTRRGGGREETPVTQQRKDVRILDIFGNAASVRVDASTWIDYMHIAKWNGRWVIVNVLWAVRAQ
jgi:Putative lumazine-binding